MVLFSDWAVWQHCDLPSTTPWPCRCTIFACILSYELTKIVKICYKRSSWNKRRLPQSWRALAGWSERMDKRIMNINGHVRESVTCRPSWEGAHGQAEEWIALTLSKYRCIPLMPFLLKVRYSIHYMLSGNAQGSVAATCSGSRWDSSAGGHNKLEIADPVSNWCMKRWGARVITCNGMVKVKALFAPWVVEYWRCGATRSWRRPWKQLDAC